MSAEIYYGGKLKINHGGITLNGDVTAVLDIGASGKKYTNQQTLSTSAANIALGDITWSTITHLWLENQSATETITLLKSSVEFAQLKPGETAALRPKADGTAIQAKGSAACEMEVIAVVASA